MERSRTRSARSYRARLSARGLLRFDVIGRESDRDLIRSLARRLSENGTEADRLRRLVDPSPAAGEGTGGILAALRRSPLVGAELDLCRSEETGRSVEL